MYNQVWVNERRGAIDAKETGTHLVVNILEQPSQNKYVVPGKHKRIGLVRPDHSIGERSVVVLEFWI